MAHARQQRVLPGQLQQLIARRHQLGVAEPGVVFQLHIEAGGVAEAGDRRRAAGDHPRFVNLVECQRGAIDDVERTVGARGAQIPVFQSHEQARHVLAVAAGAGADDGEHRHHILFLFGQEILLDLSTTLEVCCRVEPAGSCTCTVKIPRSSCGRNEVGSLMNSSAMPPSNSR